ncbi:MAG: hypothetical protein Q7S44_00205, partial [bacterium]|nr:hypothetical protein [bacterium]
MALTKNDIVLIGDEMVRALEPVYKDLDGMKKNLSGLRKDVTELREDVDAVRVDVIDLQSKAGSIKDQLVGINEKLDENRKTIRQIKRHVGL